jgi:hypothetical protein
MGSRLTIRHRSRTKPGIQGKGSRLTIRHRSWTMPGNQSKGSRLSIRHRFRIVTRVRARDPG